MSREEGPGREEANANAGPLTEEALERTLRDVGPLLRRRGEVEPPDPAFVTRLRAQLTAGVALDRLERAVDAPPHGAAPSRSRSRSRRSGLVGGLLGGLAAAALVAGAVVLGVVGVFGVFGHAHHPAVAWQPPLPSLADLVRALPAPPVAHAATVQSPLVSRAASPHGLPYAGHIALTTTPLPPSPRQVRAFRLAAATTIATPAHIARLARILGIPARPGQMTQAGVTWIVVAPKHGSSSPPLHSIAISRATGEVVYHDTSYPRRRWGTWIANPAAVAAARAWLTRLGWPGARMPLVTIEHSGLPAGVRQIVLAWVGVGTPAATPAAILWVTPHGHVIEADVWPPVESRQTIRARRLSGAWTTVRAGQAPLVVEAIPPRTTAPGQGVMRHVTITAVLSSGRDHRLYLVPTYQFAGTAVVRGLPGHHACDALTPAGG